MLFLFSNPNNEFESVHVLELMKYCITVIGQLRIQDISDCEEKLVGIFKHFSSNDQINAGSKTVFGGSEFKQNFSFVWRIQGSKM